MSDESKRHADKVTLLLGFATAILFDMEKTMNERQREMTEWFREATASVVYGDGTMPKLPDKGLH